MMTHLYAVLAACALTSSVVQAQATDISAPSNSYLLGISQRWGRTSPLGDLVRDARDSTDVEVRLWGGYGLAGTAGVILRRRAGKWSAFSAQVHECSMPVTSEETLEETLTEARMTELEARARRGCPDDSSEGTFTSVHWLTLHALPLSSPMSDVWSQLVDAGVLRVPPDPHSKWVMLDGFTYVLEVRVGNTYRASVLPQAESSTENADLIVRAVARILGFERRSKR